MYDALPSFETIGQSMRLGVLLAAFLLPLPALAADLSVVHIYNWSNYIAPETLTDFTKATGLKTDYKTYDHNETLETALFVGNSGFDVVVPTATPFFARQVQAGLFQPLPKEKIPNLKNLDPALMKLVSEADPGNRYGAIYQWGTNGLGFNPDQIKARLPKAVTNSWELILNPENAAKFKGCGIAFLNSASEVLPIILHYLGKDPNSESPADLQAAIDNMKKLRPYIRYFDSSRYIDDLAEGKICLALGWSGDVGIAEERAETEGRGVTVNYRIPQEGTILWFDMLAVPADAPNPDGAFAYINFVLDPANIAKISTAVTYANAVPASRPMIEDEVRNDPDIFPPPEVKQRLFFIRQASSHFERLRGKAWQRMVDGVE